jgi:glutamate-5-semialdehyde dehydrogenase
MGKTEVVAPTALPPAIEASFAKLKGASRSLRKLGGEKKNQVLSRIADGLLRESENILRANAEDLARLPGSTASAFRDRLTLNPARLQAMVESLRQIAALPDPVGELLEERTLSNGLNLQKVRAPLGVIFMIFESRPNVALEAFSLAFKSGNAIALRGGSESRATAEALYQFMERTIGECGVDPSVFYGMNDYDRELVSGLLERKDLIDVVVPRGGDRLIEFVQKTARMPIIKNDRGLCHTYVDAEADLAMAVKVVTNAKVQRPGVCNSLETVLVHRSVAERFLPALFDSTISSGLQWKCDAASLAILQRERPEAAGKLEPAQPSDWDTEHLDLVMNCRIVDDLEDALKHIERHGSRHSEAIITASPEKAALFQSEVDAAAVYWNASTRFTDGFEFGLGGELGISTQKLHVRGPVGLKELTTPRWLGTGTGQIRQ